MRKLEWGAAALLGLLVIWAHGLRFVHAGGLWRDEAGLAHLATLPSLGAVWRLLARDSVPILAPLAIRTYARVAGAGDQALRGFGLAVGLAVAAALWLAARSTGRSLPLLSLALVGVNAAFVVFGDSLRGYGLGSLFMLLSFTALGRLLAHPGPGTAAAALLAALGAVHSLFGNAVLVGALCSAAAIAALWQGRRRVAAAALGVGMAAGLSLLPYAATLREARSASMLVSHPVSPWLIVRVLAATLGPVAAAWLVLLGLGLAGVAWRLVRRRRDAAGARVPDTTPAGARDVGPAAAPAAVPAGPEARDARDGAAQEARNSRTGEDALRLFGALAIVLGVAGQLLFLVFLRFTPRAWYDLPLIALAGGALEPLAASLCRTPGTRLARVALALALAATQLPAALPRLRMRMTNADLVAGRLAVAAAGGDLVVVSPWHFGISFDRYYRGPASWMTLPQVADHQMHRHDLLMARLAALHPIDDVLQAARRTLAGGHRVWLVGELRLPPPGRQPPILPPAPGTAWGWDDLPYGISWELQLGALLRDHATSLRAVPVPSTDPISPLEHMPLAVADGWRG
ncbi:MAG TPA: hypothetical protein VJA16_02725 [Thermoanaerobaculia bacterium]